MSFVRRVSELSYKTTLAFSYYDFFYIARCVGRVRKPVLHNGTSYSDDGSDETFEAMRAIVGPQKHQKVEILEPSRSIGHELFAGAVVAAIGHEAHTSNLRRSAVREVGIFPSGSIFRALF